MTGVNKMMVMVTLVVCNVLQTLLSLMMNVGNFSEEEISSYVFNVETEKKRLKAESIALKDKQARSES